MKKVILFSAIALAVVSGVSAQPQKAEMYSDTHVTTTPVTSSLLSIPRGATKIILDVEIMDGNTGLTSNTTITPVWALYGGNNGGTATRLAGDTATITHSEGGSNPHDFLAEITNIPFVAEGLYLVTDTEHSSGHRLNVTGHVK